MSLLLFTYRHQDIIARKNDLNMKLDSLRRKLMDLQAYAASIADGPITMQKLMEVPPSQFDRMSIFMTYSNQVGMAGAQEKFAQMAQSGALQQTLSQVSPQQQQAYQQYIQQQMFEQARQKFADHETKLLNIEDKKLEQEKAQMETQLKMLDAEEEKVTKAEDDAAKKAAPQYVA